MRSGSTRGAEQLASNVINSTHSANRLAAELMEKALSNIAALVVKRNGRTRSREIQSAMRRHLARATEAPRLRLSTHQFGRMRTNFRNSRWTPKECGEDVDAITDRKKALSQLAEQLDRRKLSVRHDEEGKWL